jgi:hypothetical protein
LRTEAGNSLCAAILALKAMSAVSSKTALNSMFLVELLIIE